MDNDIPPHLLTYPRSGSHYLDRLIYKKIKFHIPRSHTITWQFQENNKKTKRIVTIARDPKESICSYVALTRALYPYSDPMISEKVTEYILLYNFLYQTADYIIDFQDLVDRPEDTTEKILDLLEINENNSYRFATNINYDSTNYIESVKGLQEYKNIELDFNLDLCYFYYNRLLEKKIVF